MVELVQKNLSQIRSLCEMYRVSQLWVFGSALHSEKFSNSSDIDFLYTFDDHGVYQEDFPYSANWSNLLTSLRKLLGRDIQLVAYGNFPNPYFKASVEDSKVLIYDRYAAEIAV